MINRESSEISDFQSNSAGTEGQATAKRLPVCGGGEASSVYSVADLVAAGSEAASGLVESSQSINPYVSSHYCSMAFAVPTSFLLFCHCSDIFTVHGIHMPPLAA